MPVIAIATATLASLTATLKGDKFGFSTIPLFSEPGTLERLRLLGDTSVEEKSDIR